MAPSYASRALISSDMRIAKGAGAPTATLSGKQTGIQIPARNGMSRTTIVTTDDSKETGWTNSYLPSTPPPSVAEGSGAGRRATDSGPEAPANDPAVASGCGAQRCDNARAATPTDPLSRAPKRRSAYRPAAGG